MKQSISFTGFNDVDFEFQYDSSQNEDEKLTLEADGEQVLCFSSSEARALAKFLLSITE